VPTFFVGIKQYTKYPEMNRWTTDRKPHKFTSLAAATEYADGEIEKPRGAGKTIIEVIQQKRRIDGHRKGNRVRLRLERNASGEITRTGTV
jgi:hypothetical protein